MTRASSIKMTATTRPSWTERSTAIAVLSKINSLELTPAMLALDPCSGSAVVTDPRSGEILACVTYPGYDNNRLANTMDVAYYRKLAADLSGPFYNKATQQKTAPGSTFKLITTPRDSRNGLFRRDTIFNCTGTFDLTETPLKCWLTTGHGPLNILGGIQNSCNVFFCNVAYTLGTNEEGNWSDSLSLSKLRQYANLYNMDKPSGIEVPENEPHVSDQYAIQSSIGQGTHSYTTTQLARYATTLANGGTSYNLSMIDKITDANDNVVQDYGPQVESSSVHQQQHLGRDPSGHAGRDGEQDRVCRYDRGSGRQNRNRAGEQVASEPRALHLLCAVCGPRGFDGRPYRKRLFIHERHADGQGYPAVLLQARG